MDPPMCLFTQCVRNSQVLIRVLHGFDFFTLCYIWLGEIVVCNGNFCLIVKADGSQALVLIREKIFSKLVVALIRHP